MNAGLVSTAIMETDTQRRMTVVVMAIVAVTTAVGKMRGMPAFPDRDADIATQKWRPIDEARRI